MSFQAKWGIDATWTELGEVKAQTLKVNVARNVHTDEPNKLEGVRKVAMGGGDMKITFSVHQNQTDWDTALTWVLALPATLYHDSKTLRFTVNGEDNDFTSMVLEGYNISDVGPNGNMLISYTFTGTETALAALS